MAKFNDIFIDDTKSGKKIPKEEYLSEGAYPIIDQGKQYIAGYCDESEGIYDNVPAIIFGDHTRIVKYVNTPFLLGADGVKVLKAKDANINSKYLYYALCNAKIPDTGYNRHFKWLKEIDIPIVDGIKQKLIVAKFERIERLIEQRKQQLQKLDELVKSRFIELFGDLETNPKGYAVKNLSEIAEYWNGLTYKPENISDIGTIVLRSSNIQNAQLDFADTVRVNCKITDKKFVKSNDILMCSRNGSAKLVGKVALIKEIQEPLSFGAFMMIIRSEFYAYLMIFFQLPSFRQQIVTGATTTINQITVKMMDEVKVPIPDCETVHLFDKFVQQIDKSKLEVQRSLEKLETLKKALMQKYFG